MKELVEAIIKMLVDNPDKVSINEVSGDESTILEIRCDRSDLGKIIGKQGRNANAIRTLTNAGGMKLKRRFQINIVEGVAS